jgi:hypothetical protein
MLSPRTVSTLQRTGNGERQKEKAKAGVRIQGIGDQLFEMQS